MITRLLVNRTLPRWIAPAFFRPAGRLLSQPGRLSARRALEKNLVGIAAVAALVVCPGAALAQAPAMPANGPYPTVNALLPDPSGDYQWYEAPANREIAVKQVLLDGDGYQITDQAGETIEVSFLTNNLFLLQMAVSSDHQMRFVNTGSNPLLYLPKDAYILALPFNERISDHPIDLVQNGARWYPFKSFAPAQPVFMGPAPTWGGFVNSFWFTRMVIEGGFYTTVPFAKGVTVSQTPDLAYIVDGHPYKSWAGFESYCMLHPEPDGYRGFDHGGRR